MHIFCKIFIQVIVITSCLTIGDALRCRTDDAPSDGELKRVARSCMRKFGDMAFAQNSQQQQQQQQYQQQQQSQGRQRAYNRENRGYHYEDSEENDNYDFDDDQFYNNNNNNRNYNRQHYGNNNNNNNRNGHNPNNNNYSGGHNDDRQRSRNRYNNNNQNKNQTENNNNYWHYSNQKTANRDHNGNNNNNKHNNYNNNNQNNTTTGANCIVHCFFNEMHMLNNDDYPDRHKMLYILTKDIRDRELRNFYTDTIQECFRYLENQRRRDRCQFSRDLIACMTEYAKGNCEDWNEFSMMFN